MKNILVIVLLLVMGISMANGSSKAERQKRFEAKKNFIIKTVESKISLKKTFLQCVKNSQTHKEISICKKEFKKNKKILKNKIKADKAKLKHTK